MSPEIVLRFLALSCLPAPRWGRTSRRDPLSCPPAAGDGGAGGGRVRSPPGFRGDKYNGALKEVGYPEGRV